MAAGEISHSIALFKRALSVDPSLHVPRVGAIVLPRRLLVELLHCSGMVGSPFHDQIVRARLLERTAGIFLFFRTVRMRPDWSHVRWH